MSVIGSNVLAGASGQSTGDFEVSRSLRFNSGDSAFLNRQPSSAGNRKTWTWSGWVKRSAVGTKQIFLGVQGTSDTTYVENYFATDDKLYLRFGYTSVAEVRTTQVFRDVASWAHIVIAFNVTESAAADKLKLYINGSQVTDFSTDTRSSFSNQDYGVNRAGAHKISGAPNGSGDFLDAYLAEVNFIDGAALDPTSFGQADDNGVWQAIDTAGLTFGTNGFRLEFADNSGATATTLGKDTSGNSNNWTPNNLSVGTVSNLTAKQNFDVLTYTGTGSAQSITGLSFQPDFVWLKRTSQAADHCLSDSVRGFGASGSSKLIYSNVTNAEDTGNTQIITSFNSNGFTLGTNGLINGSGHSHVAWCWKAGGAASSNTSGTITSSVSANTSYGFSVCTYTGNNTSGATVGHSLNAVPALIILKDRSSAYNWQVYHKSFAGTSNGIVLNSTAAIDTGSGSVWNSTTPTSTVFSIGNSVGVNKSGDNYVAYVWSEIAGFSKFGTFSHPSTTSIDFGFTPRFWLVKETDGTTPWYIFDAERDNFDDPLFANTNGTAGSGFAFTVSGTTISWIGGSFASGNYIYAAFAATVDESAINDCFVDTPTNAATPSDSGVGGEVVGNYCTWSPLNKGSNMVLSNGNLDIATTTGTSAVTGTIGVSSGKWYWETTINSANDRTGVGIAQAGMSLTDIPGDVDSLGWCYYADGGTKRHGGSSSSYGSGFSGGGDVIGTALDLDAGTIIFYKNGVSQGTAFTGLSGEFFPANGDGSGVNNANSSTNFGQRAFSYPLSGHKSLNTANLPEPTIADGSKYFDSTIYTGNGSGQTITLTNSGFSPDWVWIKSRNQSANHWLVDVVRGADQRLITNGTQAEASGGSSVVSFTSTGFVLGTDTFSSTNENNDAYVAWTWDGGTSTVTNNDGSIASQVRANPTAGFSIVSFDPGSTTGDQSVGHGLNDAPSLILLKNREDAGNWLVFDSSVCTTVRKLLRLNTTDSLATEGSNIWGGSLPSSTTFGVTVTVSAAQNKDHIAYCFAPVAGYSAMGSYTGSGSNDGSFIFTNFAVKWVLIKCTSAAGQEWVILDSARSPSNVVDDALYANDSAAEASNSTRDVDFLSNGFKLRNGSSGATDFSGRTYIYLALASNPFASNGGLAR